MRHLDLNQEPTVPPPSLSRGSALLTDYRRVRGFRFKLHDRTNKQLTACSREVVETL